MDLAQQLARLSARVDELARRSRLLDATGAADGSGSGMWAKITAAAAAPATSTGSVWLNGYGDGTGADLTGVSIRMPGLASGQTPITTIPYPVVALADDGVYEVDGGIAG